MLSANLAIINLIPIRARWRAHFPLHDREHPAQEADPAALEFVQKLGFAILLPLIVFVFYNDISRLTFFK